MENNNFQDEVFGRWKMELEEQQSRPQQRPPVYPQAPALSNRQIQLPSSSPSDLQDLPPNSHFSQHQLQAPAATSALADPTEVLIYGFKPSLFPAALCFYEAASRGRIYEDYDRGPGPAPRFADPFLSQRGTLPRSLSRDALRRINTFTGGETWIKVTFDSPQAAEIACHESPHIIGGCNVHAEIWRGVGPDRDVAISVDSGVKEAKQAETMREGLPSRSQSQSVAERDFRSLPRTMSGMSSGLRNPTPSSANPPQDPFRANAALGEAVLAAVQTEDRRPGPIETEDENALRQRRPNQTNRGTFAPQEGPRESIPQARTAHTTTNRALGIPTAKRLALLPANDALMPMPPLASRALGALPIVGSLFAAGTAGSAGAAPQASGSGTGVGVIGSAVPRTDRGEFDWQHASLWWCFCWYIDRIFGTDLCGMRGDD